eukprot:9010568-Alexandrium_andersonii.AAC.1
MPGPTDTWPRCVFPRASIIAFAVALVCGAGGAGGRASRRQVARMADAFLSPATVTHFDTAAV